MRDHPTTFRGEPAGDEGIQWGDRAAIYRKDGEGALNGIGALHRGTFAEMIAIIRSMPETDRSEFAIEKAGDRRYEADEIMALADREDFPG